eukprot:scaffold44188_cov63-Phaeocystis_antarctica.AAC.6
MRKGGAVERAHNDVDLGALRGRRAKAIRDVDVGGYELLSEVGDEAYQSVVAAMPEAAGAARHMGSGGMANSGTGGGGQGRGYGEELPGKYGGEDGGGEHVLGAVARDGVKHGGRERAVGGGEEGADAWVERIGGEKGRVEGEEGGDGGEGG